jgi:cell division protease FtsH
MSDQLGRVRLLAPNTDLYLGGSAGLERLSESVHERLDAEVRRLVGHAFERATEILTTLRALLEDLVARLLENETLEGEELRRFLVPATGATLPA